MKSFFKQFFLFCSASYLLSCSSSHQKSEVAFEPTEFMFEQKYNFYEKAEELRYNVKLAGATGGEVTVKTDTLVKKILGKPCYHTTVTVTAKGAVDLFTNLYDVFESFADTSTRLPVMFKRNIKEGGYIKLEETRFDRESVKAIVSDFTEKEVDTFNISANIHDAISSYFVFRSIPFEDLKIGDTLKMDVFLEDKPYNFDILIVGRETLKFEKEKVNCWVIAPYMPGNDLMSGENSMKAWISDDKRRIPLKFKAKLPIGSAEVVLKSYKAHR